MVAMLLVCAIGGVVVADQPEVRSTVFCREVDRQVHQPIGEASVFSASDEAVYCFVNIVTPRDVRVEFRWFTPDGDLYRTRDVGLLRGPSGQGASVGWYVYAGIAIAGAPAASQPGRWTVKVVLSPGRDATKSFQLAGTSSGGDEPAELVLPPPRTPPAGGDVLLSDDFGDPASGWESRSDSTGGYGYADGGYYVDVKRPNQTRWVLAGRQFGDTIIEVDAAAGENGGADASWGLICRFQDNQNFYLFEITADGYYGVSVLSGNTWSTLADWAKSSAIKTGAGLENHLRVTVDEHRLSFSVNDVRLASLTDDTFSKGDIGFAVTSYTQGGMRVVFDDLVVSRPE